MKNKYLIVIILVISSLIGIIIYETREKQKEEYIITQDASDDNASSDNDQISGEAAEHISDTDSETSIGTVSTYVCGEVEKPGVYELPGGSRVADAIEMAGGMLDTAAVNYLNLADVIIDGSKIYVPTQEEVSDISLITPESQLYSGTGSGSNSTEEAGEESSALVNINTADAATLKTLPGIGDTRAQAIIDYRTNNGLFSSISDIKNVSGIGDSIYANIESKITVD